MIINLQLFFGLFMNEFKAIVIRKSLAKASFTRWVTLCE